MKKIVALLSVFTLFGLISCVHTEDFNSGKDVVKNEVKTSFTINVATNAQTKATATEVQDGTAFRGMEQMKLYVFKDLPTKEDPMENYQYDLGTLAANEITDAQSSKIYNLSIPLGVNNMTFFGRAKVSTTKADYEKYGILEYNVGAKKSEIFFNTIPIVSDLTDFNATATAIATMLNDVIAAKVDDNNTWAGLATSTNVLMKPLKDLYVELTTIQTGEFRDGSGPGVLRVLTDLRKAVAKITSPADAAAMATAIKNKIDTYVDSDGAFVTEAYATFPASFGLPNGAAQLTFADGAFKYVTSPASLGNVADAITSVTDFIYPAELCYFVSSPIRVSSDESIVNTDYPKTVSTWAATDWGTKWPTTGINGTIASTTRAVALQNNIQYAVALLKTTVQYGGSTVADNRAAILKRKDATSTEQDMSIEVSASSFQLKGILVGGQPAGADNWWLPKADGKKVVYDHYMTANGPAAIPASGKSNPVYTMVLDNYSSSGNQSVVYVALELVNKTGADFYGRDNLIPKDGTFYMVGKLDLSTLTDAQKNAVQYPVNTDTNGQRMAPYATDGTNDKVLRIFMQDFVTEANFKITNLHGAYSTVPDLRAVTLTFGLSVDLKWTAGLPFDITLD